MSTTIKDASDGVVHKLTTGAASAHLVIFHAFARDNLHVQADMSRADFLAAVAQECGVIIIDKSELPEVTLDRGGYLVDGERFYQDTDRAALARKWALRDLALAEYLDAHPPVDEADVEALATALDNEAIDLRGDDDFKRLARRLLATGRIEVKK